MRSVSTVPFAGADRQAVQFVAEPFHPSFRATCRANGFFRAIALELDLSADGTSLVSSLAVKILNSDFVPTLATFKPKKCSLRSVPLAKPLVRRRSELATLELGALIEPESTLRSVHPKRISVNVRYPIRDRYLRFMRSWSCMTPRAWPLTCGTRSQYYRARGARPAGDAAVRCRGWFATLWLRSQSAAWVVGVPHPLPWRKSPRLRTALRLRSENRQRVQRRSGAARNAERRADEQKRPAAPLPRFAGQRVQIQIVEERHAETDQRQLVQRIDQALDVRGDDVAHAVGADLYPTRGRTEQQPSVDSRVGRKRGAKASSSGFQNVNERRVLTLSPSDSDSSPKTPKCREMAHVRVTGTIG